MEKKDLDTEMYDDIDETEIDLAEELINIVLSCESPAERQLKVTKELNKLEWQSQVDVLRKIKEFVTSYIHIVEDCYEDLDNDIEHELDRLENFHKRMN